MFMNKSFVAILLIALSFYHCTNQLNNSTNMDINGVWEDSNSSAFQNTVLVLSEQDGKVNVAHYLEWKGKKFVESGTGTREGNSIVYTAKVTLPIEGWAKEGTHTLTLSEDGKTLRGVYSDNNNKNGPIVFKKIR